MAVSPEILLTNSRESIRVVAENSDPRVLPLRRSRTFAESVALNTAANDVPVYQVVSIWAGQKGTAFIEQLLQADPYNSMPDEEKGRLLRYASRTIALDWIDSLGLNAPTRAIDDKIFYHKSLLT